MKIQFESSKNCIAFYVCVATVTVVLCCSELSRIDNTASFQILRKMVTILVQGAVACQAKFKIRKRTTKTMNLVKPL